MKYAVLAVLLMMGSAQGPGKFACTYVDSECLYPHSMQGIYILESDDPIVVPAVQIPTESVVEIRGESAGCSNNGHWAGTKADIENTWLTYRRCEGGTRLGCADGNRILLHSDNGQLHVCLKLPVQEADNYASH